MMQKTLNLIIDKKDPPLWKFSGDLTVFALSNSAKEWIRLFPVKGPWEISGEKISSIDTAGLAFLLECISHAKKHSIKLRFVGLPPAVSPLMKAQGVEKLITDYVEN